MSGKRPPFTESAGPAKRQFLKSVLDIATLKPFPPLFRYGILIGLPVYWAYSGWNQYNQNRNQIQLFNPTDVEQWNRAVKAQWAMTPKEIREKQQKEDEEIMRT